MSLMQGQSERIAARVRSVAAEHRVKQTALAGTLGLSRVALNRRINGHIPFTAAELSSLAGFFNVPVGRFFESSSLSSGVAAPGERASSIEGAA